MTEIRYKITNFEGPMDLLLHLISKHKLNICDIPIFTLVEQYLAVIEEMKEQDLDIASEFLEMAARLVHIKSLSLLPIHEEGEKLRRELSGELIEYAACKNAALKLSQQTEGFNALSRAPERIETDMTYQRIHDPLELLNAYMRAVGKRFHKLPPPFESFRPLVARKIVSVSSKIKSVVAYLSGGRRSFREILRRSESRSDMVAAFLAILELAKTNHIYIEDDGTDFSIRLLKVPEGELDFD